MKDDLTHYMEATAKWKARAAKAEARGDRLYDALAAFDTRGDSWPAWVVAAARDGYEHSHPDVNEDRPWDELDAALSRRPAQFRFCSCEGRCVKKDDVADFLANWQTWPGKEPGLILCVVADEERDEAVERIRNALDP